MKKQVLFIHSAGPQARGEGSSGLVADLREQLGGEYDFLAPQMPTPENPRYGEWKDGLEKEFSTLEGGAVLVGHSIGGSALLKFMSEEEVGKSVAGLVLIASPFWGLEDWLFDEFTLTEHFAGTLPKLPHVYIYHSAEDEVVPFKHAEQYAQQLQQAAVHKLDGVDHLFLNGIKGLAEEIRGLLER